MKVTSSLDLELLSMERPITWGLKAHRKRVVGLACLPLNGKTHNVGIESQDQEPEAPRQRTLNGKTHNVGIESIPLAIISSANSTLNGKTHNVGIERPCGSYRPPELLYSQWKDP